MADRLTTRINTARSEIDDSLDDGRYLHNIVVTNNAEDDTFEFVCLAHDHRWESVRISTAVLEGPYAAFAATVGRAIEIVQGAFAEPVYTVDGDAASPGVTIPSTQQLFDEGQRFFDTDPLSPTTGQLHLPPAMSQTGPTAIPVPAAAATAGQPSLLQEKPRSRFMQALDRLEGRTADLTGDFRAPAPAGDR